MQIPAETTDSLLAAQDAVPSGTPPALAQPARSAAQKAGWAIGLMAVVTAIAVASIGAAVLIPALSSGKRVPDDVTAMLIVGATFTLMLFVISAAVTRRSRWGRYAGIAYGLFALFGVPIGTVAGVYILWQLLVVWRREAPIRS